MSQSIVLQFIAQFVRERKEFHSMAVVTYAVKVICIGESKKRLESTLKLFLFQQLAFSVASVILTSRKIVLQDHKLTTRELLHCEHLHLGDTGKLYQKVLLRFFAWLTWINLKRTSISSENFLNLLKKQNIYSC